MPKKDRPTWKCRWVPRRTVARVYTAKDAARVACYAVKNGATRQQIDTQFELVCPDVPNPRTPTADAIAMQAQAVAQGNMEVLNDAYQTFLTINLVLLALFALPAILRRSPALFVIFRGLGRVQVSVAHQVTVIGRQLAANEGLYTAATIALRRAA